MPTMTTSEEPVETPHAPRSSRGQRVWAVLLVLDSFFVIIFGGALAAKIYQHWQEPAAPVIPARAHRPAKAAAVKPEAKQPDARPAPAPAAPAPAAESAASGPRPPKPSLIQDAPLHQSAALQGSAQAPAAAAGDAAKVKALPTQFSLKAPGARSVELAGAFIVHGGKKAMTQHGDGTWTVTVYLTPNTYRYWFVVNGRHTLDPRNPSTDRNASVVTVSR